MPEDSNTLPGKQAFSAPVAEAIPPKVKTYLNRLLAVLPHLYTLQPGNSAVGTLLRTMATALAELDKDTQRVLHDRWVGLATGQTTEAGLPSALQRLGHLLQVKRLAWRTLKKKTLDKGILEVEFPSSEKAQKACLGVQETFPDLICEVGSGVHKQSLVVKLPPIASGEEPSPSSNNVLEQVWAHLHLEPDEQYRERLQTTAPILLQGLTTPRALLSLAIADLGAAPCPQMERIQDATVVAWGVPPSLRQQCSVCHGHALPSHLKAKKHCPYRETALLKVWLLENPPQKQKHSLEIKDFKDHFVVNNPSICSDRPVLRIQHKVSQEGNHKPYYLGLQNRNTGETVLLTRCLAPGETLTIMPECIPEENKAFHSYGGGMHHLWHQQTPQGRAFLSTRTKDDKTQTHQDVSNHIVYMLGYRFNQAASRFVGKEQIQDARFGLSPRRVRTPDLQCGDNEWAALAFPPYDPAVAPIPLPMDTEGPPHVRLILEMEWVARPPASLRLSIPSNGWVNDAKEWGALDLLQSNLEQVRAAGVRAWVDFPQPIYQERHGIGDRPLHIQIRHAWQENNDLADAMSVPLAHETHNLDDGQPAFGGRFNTTRWNWSYLQ